MQRERLPYLLIPLTALIAVLPLLLNGCSCGHDFDFHVLNWLEAARQFTHGNLHPHWAYTPAYNAGEPRFVFYPPLSWTIGAILGLFLPWTWTPIAYTWLVLTAAGLTLHRLARAFASPTAALLAAPLYTVNPYTLFTAYERTAYAELLAAVWIPLLLKAALAEKISIPKVAIPIALLWLTNAPAAVMSCYALALLTLIRIIAPIQNPGAPCPASGTWAFAQSANPKFRLATNILLGTTLGLGLASFYIVPAAWQRRFVQIAMAVIPNMRIADNFLFHHTGDVPHDQVLHTASIIALILIAATTLALITARKKINLSIAILTIAIALSLTPLTAPLWNHLPELAFLQFPWRLLAILAALMALAAALALANLTLKPRTLIPTTIAIAATLTWPAYTVFHQSCDPEDTVASRLTAFRAHQGTEPTDEYTPTTADNDSLAPNNPAWWLSTDPNSKAPANSTPAPAPPNLSIHSLIPQTLILNLRDYPAWRITLNQTPISTRQQRDDGLIAIPIPAGTSTIAIRYAHTLDQTIGNTLSGFSLILLLIAMRKRNVLPDEPPARRAVTS